MPTFVLLTRLSPESVRSPETLERLEGEAMERIRGECPDVETAAKVATLIRIHGHAQTETWAAVEWGRFKELVHELSGGWAAQKARPE